MLNMLVAAKKYYPAKGSHGWEHITRVMVTASAMVRATRGPKAILYNREIAALLFHDAGLMYGRDDHEITGAAIVRAELPKLGFAADDVRLVAAAIREHRASYTGTFTSELSDLVSSADRNRPDFEAMLRRAYNYRIEKGMPHDDAVVGAYTHTTEKYGENGYARFPRHYMAIWDQRLHRLKERIHNTNIEEAYALLSK